jgi:hypothetical protein
MKRARVDWVIVGTVMSMSTGGILGGCGGGDDTATPSPGSGGADGSAPVDATEPEAGAQLDTDGNGPASTGADGATETLPSDGGASLDAGPIGSGDDADDAGDIMDAALALSDASRFITGVVQFNPTGCTGFGASSLPGIVEGPPVGGGSAKGSTDVVSLGSGGSIVVTFAPNAIVDGPGDDFIVFENPFWVGGNSNDIYAEPGEVSVSDDGETWTPFPCTPTFDAAAPYGTGVVPPYGACAGWGVVYSAPGNGISPFDPATAGGNAYDLADIGVTHARFVRIVDRTAEACPDAGGPNDNGFDLDAIAIINAELP